jgi:hypothetical protein
VTTRRWTDDYGLVWFAVGGIDADYESAAEQLLMDYERTGTEWRRGYPGDTPHLEQAWQNFAGRIDQVVRQAARREPVPWRDALRELCHRTIDTSRTPFSDRTASANPAATTNDRTASSDLATTVSPASDEEASSGSAGGKTGSDDRPVRWWLTGSAALAVRGAPIEPGDLDLVCEPSDAIALGELFSDALIEPVTQCRADGLSEWWGRAFCRARIEWVGGVRPFVDDPEPSDFGPAAGRHLETVQFEDWQILVPPLDLQRAVNQRRGLADRVTMIDALTT